MGIFVNLAAEDTGSGWVGSVGAGAGVGGAGALGALSGKGVVGN